MARRTLEVPEMVRDLLGDALLQLSGNVTAHPGDIEQQEQRQGRRALRVVQPVDVAVVERRGIRLQATAAVPADDIVDDRSRLGDRPVAVGDARRSCDER